MRLKTAGLGPLKSLLRRRKRSVYCKRHHDISAGAILPEEPCIGFSSPFGRFPGEQRRQNVGCWTRSGHEFHRQTRRGTNSTDPDVYRLRDKVRGELSDYRRSLPCAALCCNGDKKLWILEKFSVFFLWVRRDLNLRKISFIQRHFGWG